MGLQKGRAWQKQVASGGDSCLSVRSGTVQPYDKRDSSTWGVRHHLLRSARHPAPFSMHGGEYHRGIREQNGSLAYSSRTTSRRNSAENSEFVGTADLRKGELSTSLELILGDRNTTAHCPKCQNSVTK